ncbi:MAG: hydroxymethylglutaryl-CoA lyase [Crocinitomicaceae bacterium]|nr:hydroxymethylglutaryl-CoA lyase [Crocinitomicaceae bacterium]MCF8410466.1 hydroxymethylglutaryl-CoA lyase [Crocinitomicaceae bacterium]MCF8444060.1 hydroxymethylglutaryl-CoA lyase [Crocinitomicaceae bacterium]
MGEKIKIIECPRDAMQGIHEFIPTQVKIDYINKLLECGFDTIDFGSFVSPKAIPQMRDTAEVLSKLKLNTDSKLLAIIANERGAEEACSFEEINYLGYPFSISEEFQKRNTNSSIEETLKRLEAIQTSVVQSNKKLVLYISMGFGNPYGEKWSPDLVLNWAERLYKLFDIQILALSDTIGSAKISDIEFLFQALIPNLPHIEFGAHMHVRPENAMNIIQAAYSAGCRRFDGAIRGFGGCPMAKDDLTGNMPTEKLISFCTDNHIDSGVENIKFHQSLKASELVF